MRDALCVGLRLSDQWRKARAKHLRARAVHARFSKTELREMPIEAVCHTQAENKRLQQVKRDRGKEPRLVA